MVRPYYFWTEAPILSADLLVTVGNEEGHFEEIAVNAHILA